MGTRPTGALALMAQQHAVVHVIYLSIPKERDSRLVVREKKITFKSVSSEETIKFGERLGKLLAPGHVIALLGELGAGKTTMVKGIVQGLGVTDRHVVKSPTFSLVHKYDGRFPVYHFDAYRLRDAQEMFDIGSDEVIYGNGVSVIEWADRVSECLPGKYLKITLIAISENERKIELCSNARCYDEIIDKLVIN